MPVGTDRSAVGKTAADTPAVDGTPVDRIRAVAGEQDIPTFFHRCSTT